MNSLNWFSAKLRFVVLVEPVGGDTLYERLFLLRAADFNSAFERAIAIGKAEETEYRNENDKRVLWRFMEIVALDLISSNTLDGAELTSEYKANPDGVISFDHVFKPESSKPIQTI